MHDPLPNTVWTGSCGSAAGDGHCTVYPESNSSTETRTDDDRNTGNRQSAVGGLLRYCPTTGFPEYDRSHSANGGIDGIDESGANEVWENESGGAVVNTVETGAMTASGAGCGCGGVSLNQRTIR